MKKNNHEKSSRLLLLFTLATLWERENKNEKL